VDVVPTFTTSNARICLLLSNGRYGALRIEDAERLQVKRDLLMMRDLLSHQLASLTAPGRNVQS